MPNQSGPLTDTGKQTSSQNALQHGMTARTPLIKGEDPAAREALHAQWHEAFPTPNAHAYNLVTTAADAEWLLRRVERSHDQINARLFEVEMPNWTPENHAEYQRITRYLTTKQRALDRDRGAIFQYRRDLRAEARQAQLTEAAAPKEQQKEADSKPKCYLPKLDDTPTNLRLEQHISIIVRDGQTRSVCAPTNAGLLILAGFRLEDTLVTRHLNFEDNHIPPEYAWCAQEMAAAEMSLAPGRYLSYILRMTVKSLRIALDRETDGHAKIWPDLWEQDEPIVIPLWNKTCLSKQ